MSRANKRAEPLYQYVERAEFYTGMYRLIIEYSFIPTDGSFNNRAELYQDESERTHG
jgi:sporulation-control protein spo0M